MTIAELGSVGELVGAIAVLATLIYLSIQTRLTRQAAQETDKADVDWFIGVLIENPVAIDKWNRVKEVVRAISPILVETVESAIDNP